MSLVANAGNILSVSLGDMICNITLSRNASSSRNAVSVQGWPAGANLRQARGGDYRYIFKRIPRRI